MPRGKRLNVIGGVYHLFTRGIERKEIFKDDTDREEFLTRFEDALDKTKSVCYAWVLMPNHIHLMIRTGKGSLSDIARRILTGYAIYFNARYKRRGYLYQNRYKSILCQEDIYFEELVRYIHLNPLKAKIVATTGQLDKYAWSGHAVLVGNKQYAWQDRDEVLLYFGKRKKEAINRYQEFIKDGMIKKDKIDFLGGGLVRSVGGWSNLVGMKRKKEYWRGDERILGDDAFVNRILKETEESLDQRDKLIREGWDLSRIAKRTCEILNLELTSIKRRGKNNLISEARALISYWACRELGISGKDAAEFLGVSNPAVSKNITKGEKIAEEKDYKLIS
ncbi:MAG: transposase [Candidatus Omnitrophota bacterium]